MDPYKILQLDRNASNDTIRKAYIKLAMKYHPDRNRGKSPEIQKEYEDKIKEINNAYDILLNKNKSNIPENSNYADVAERIFNEAKLFGKYFFDIVQEVTENINVNLNIDIFDIYNNIEKEFSIQVKRKCKKCMGMGINIINKNYEPCIVCSGDKFKLIKTDFKINSGEGRHIFFKKGNEEYGKRTGNVVVNIIPKNLQNYKIINQFDLLLYVNKNENITFKHLDNINYTVKDILKPNTIYTIKNMGLYNNDLIRGNLNIQYLNNIPKYDNNISIQKI